MPSQRNIQQLAILKEKLEKAASGVFVDHSGLKVSDQQALRAKLREVDGDFLVAKNTLLSLALGKHEARSHSVSSSPSGCSVLKTSQSKELSPRAIQAASAPRLSEELLRSLQARRDERLSDLGVEGASSYLTGPTSLVLSYHDEVLPIKVLAQFSKNHEKPVIKGGFLGGKPLTGEEVLRISQLPDKKELLGQLVRQMQAPMVGMINVVQGNLRKLVYALQAISKRVN